MKKLLLGLLTLAIITLTLTLTSCQQPAVPSLGTPPSLTKFVITNNSASVTAETVNSLTPITSVTVYPAGTDKDNASVKYKEVITFTDPDKDVVKAEFSFDNFATKITANMTQSYENQITTWQNQFYTTAQITGAQTTYSIRLIDSKGNVSNTMSITVTKAN